MTMIGSILIFAGAASFIAQWHIEPRSEVLGLYWIAATLTMLCAGVILVSIEAPYRPVSAAPIAAVPIAGSPLNTSRIERAFRSFSEEAPQ